MRILGIETSCDETGAAVIEAKTAPPEVGSESKKVTLISNVLASSLSLHSKTGGIIPETAAREQIKYIIPVIERALVQSGYSEKKMVNGKSSMVNFIDAIAVTVGPGLIGSLLVGVETAKTLSYIWDKPIIPVNHLFGHIYANWIIEDSKRKMENILFPAIALIVSGGHTDLVLIKDHTTPATLARSAGGREKLKWLGGTRDDAAGEALDKIGRILGLSYPGGPEVEKAAKNGDPKAFEFPRPMIDSNDFDFSFSGLKAAVFREVNKLNKIDDKIVANISVSVQQNIIDVLVSKTIKAAKKYKVKSILLGGGVAANQKLRDDLRSSIANYQSSIKFFVPSKNLCTDNAAMIAAAAFYNYNPVDFGKVTANPELYFD